VEYFNKSNMRKIRLSLMVSLTLLLALPAFSQNVPKLPEPSLEIKWQLITNNYNNGDVNQSSITITNTGDVVLPAIGWAVYFNYNRKVFPEMAKGGLLVAHVNGDLFQIKPAAAFTGLKPDSSVTVLFVSEGNLLNYTAAPCGLYFVWDANPAKGYTITNYTIEPIPDTAAGFVTPEVTFSNNQAIRDIPTDSLPKIFPTPIRFLSGNGEFHLDTKVRIVTEREFANEAAYLSDEMNLLLGKKLVIAASTTDGQEIILTKVPMAEEAYQLDIQPGKVVIAASTAAGIFYGIQSLKSCMPVSAWEKTQSWINIPAMHVDDTPRFGYRGFMLDVARNFHSKAELLKVIDVMAAYKMNTLHLHFSDDEGWRIEIPSLPELTEVGAQRGHTLDSKEFLPASYGSGPEPGCTRGSGYYSRTDFIEILKYATQRHIQIIPEIESPGHSRAAIKAMDMRYRRFMEQGNKTEAERFLLRDINDQSKYSTAQLWTDNVMCVALPSTYTFIGKVVDELKTMYSEANAPLTTIHLGGDEVPAGTWQHSPICNALIETDSTVNSTDDLWYYYFTKINALLKERNLVLTGWEEIGMRKTIRDGEKCFIPNPGFANNGFRVNVWNNGIGWGSEDLPYRLANAGYQVILSCVSHLYFDLAYEKSPKEPGYYWGGFNDSDKSFNFIPYDYYKNTTENTEGTPIDASLFVGKDRLTDYGKSNILGIQCQLWSENVRTDATLEYLLLPKLLALAERAWAPDPSWATELDNGKARILYTNAWSVFVNTLGKKELPRLDCYQGGLNYRIPPVGAVFTNGKVLANIQIPGFTIRYTTDGTEPTIKSKPYMSPIPEKGVITLCAFSKNGRKGRSITIVNK